MEHRPDIGIFVEDGHYNCAPMVKGLRERGLHLVSKLGCNTVLCLLSVVFVLDIDAAPEEEVRPVTFFATDPEIAPEQIYRMYRDRFQIEFNFRNAKQHLGLAACQDRTGARYHFHVNAVLAALAWKTGVGPTFRHGRAGPDPATIPGGPQALLDLDQIESPPP